MDRFKKEMSKRCGVGGLKCFCCNDYMRDKPKLRRTARRVLKGLLNDKD